MWNVVTIGKEKKSPACLGVWLKAEVEVVAFPRLHWVSVRIHIHQLAQEP